MQGIKPVQNNEEYDLSLMDSTETKEFNLGEVAREIFFYLLPIISFILFVFILFVAVIPGLEVTKQKLDSVDQLKAEDKKLKTRIENIRALEVQSEENQVLIDKLNALVPTGKTEIVKFGDRIKLVTTLNLLLSDKLTTGEAVLVGSTGGTGTLSPEQLMTIETTTLPLHEIPTKFDIRGKYEDIRAFFRKLYEGVDFFVVNEMTLDANESGEWFGEISLVKYQFSPGKNFDPVKAYTGITEANNMNSDVIQFLKERFVDDVYFEDTTETDVTE